MRSRPLTLIALALIPMLAAAAHAAPTLVELFTSEGCSSCPPADAYLHELTQTPQAEDGETVFIAWHVDYWDHLGWKEPYAIPQSALRQRAYAQAMKSKGVEGSGVYTPQMIVNGRYALVGSNREQGRTAIGHARRDDTQPLDLKVSTQDQRITIAATLPDLPDGASVMGVLVEDALSSDVKSGENAGKTLTHDRVARSAAQGEVDGDHATITLTVPQLVDPAHASVVVFAQAAGMGPILALGSAPLKHEPVSRERYQSVDMGKRQIRYALILPDGFDPDKTYPALLALPPGAQNEQMVEAALGLYWEKEAKMRGWIVVSPINPSFARMFESRLDPLGKLADDITSRFNIEGGKLHLAGVSNGGRAAFIEILSHPDRYQSLTTLPGMMAQRTPETRIKKLADIPVAMFVGGDDHDWLRESQRTLDELKAQGVDATLTVREGEGHLVSVPPKELFDLLEMRRP